MTANLSTAFDRVYLISLPYCEGRRERAVSELVNFGLVDRAEDITIMNATSGDALNGAPAWWNAGSGAFGCWASHLRCVWEASSDGLESFAVFEDDVIAHSHSLKVFSECWDDLKSRKWGQFYLGGQLIGTPPANEFRGSRTLIHPTNVNRTHGYALHKRAFGAFSAHVTHAPDYLENPKGWHIDHQLGTAHERGDWLTLAPRWWVVGQGENNSNVSGQSLPELWWFWQRFKTRLPIVLAPANWTEDTLEKKGLKNILHFGNKLVEGTLKDMGLRRVFADEEPEARANRLQEFLGTITREALDMRRLPAVSHAQVTRKLLEMIWQPELILKASDVRESDADYPFSGRFAFDWRAPSTPETLKAAAA